MRLIDEDNIKGFGYEHPTYYDVNNIVAELKEITDFIKCCTKYDKKNANKQAKSYRTMMYEFADLVDDLIEIVKRDGKNE